MAPAFPEAWAWQVTSQLIRQVSDKGLRTAPGQESTEALSSKDRELGLVLPSYNLSSPEAKGP
jgi:hypothetical protein